MADQVRDIAAFTAFAEKNPQDAFRFLRRITGPVPCGGGLCMRP